ncbi:antitoxin Xre-like helix-turn-helix domain-containing protein [Kordia jejudonensis]|uniref:antitoxin Xre-like helix-turn-helix domain-containing protein n=1 Tax=Kordia jejudonensis TaxID=1348245 RepID=UPI00069B8DBD|nr:antitoxin Xre-like helix-turn-helix domain-containing protein [Kordia jejudonensis]
MNKIATHTKFEKSTADFYKILDEIIQPDIDNFVPIPKIKNKAASVGEQIIMYTSSKTASTHASHTKIPEIGSTRRKKETAELYFSYSAIDTITSARSGVKFNDFKKVYDLMQLSNTKWAEIIGVSERTMQSILKDKKNLDQNKSEKLLSFLTLIEYALNVLESKENVEEWLGYKSPALQGKSPIDYVDTFQGITMLREQLFKIDSGNLV